MKRLLTTMLLLLCLGQYASAAVIPDMKFRRLDTRDGLSNSQINYLFQDSRGYIWIGTSYGLNRYDGYRFHTYFSDARDTMTLRNNYVDQIWEDYDGKLWLKQGMNYSFFDPVTEKVVRNPSSVLSKLGITGGIDRIYVDSRKNLWVKTYDEGLYCYNPRTKQKTMVKYGYGPEEFPKEFWFSWFAEHNGLLIVSSSDGDLMAVDGEKGRVVWKDSYMREHGGQTQSSYTVYVDHFGNYWVLTNNSTYIKSQKENKWYNSVNSFLESKGISGLPADLLVWDVMMDQRNWLWFATDHEGLIVIDMQSKEVKQFLNNKFDETSLSENTVKHLLLDKSGNMWIGAYRNGLNQYIEKMSGITNIELGDINTAVEDNNGLYWLGTDNRGIIKYNPATGESQLIDRSNSGIASNTMVSSCRSRDGALWFGTYNGGLIQINPDGHITNYLATEAENGLLNNNIWSVTEDRWGDIWLGTLGNGVQRLNRKTGKFQTWSSYNTPLRENFMTSIGWIKKGWLLAGHSTYFSIINPVSGKVVNFSIPEVPGKAAAAPATTCVVEDSRGLIWQGSMSGCCVFDRVTGWQKLLDMNSGLYGSSIVGIVEDLRHTMWVVTEHGISNVTPQKDDDGQWTFLVRSFSSKDGLQQGPYNQRSVSLARDGKVLVGGLGGLDIIDPSHLSSSGNKERPIFSGLKLYGQQVEVGKEYDGRVVLEAALDTCRELVLRYDENQFTIQLATDKGEAHNPARFIYQLEGFSDRWIKTEETDPNISYMSLHHGDYLLRVRMLNDDGSMGEYESTLKITITPPLLRNRWLMLLFILLVAAGVYFWRRRFLARHKERAELEAKRREVEKKQWKNEMLLKLRNNELDEELGEISKKVADPVKPGGLNLQPGDLQEFMKEQCSQYKAPRDKRLKFSFFPLADDLVVNFDHEMLGQAIQILLNNSVMFTPRDCRIKVFVDKTPTSASIRISDNGIGMPEGAKEHMFDPMVSDDDSGVCLFIVHDIVKAHGGTVTGDDNAGGGTVFTITLPIDSPAEEVEEAVVISEQDV